MLVVVTGSRKWPQELTLVLNATMASLSAYTPPPLIAVRHGGAEGADTLADRAARHYGYTVEEPWRPDYTRYAAAVAPLRRNEAMLDTDPRPDLVVAFMLGTPGRGGTLHTVNEAKRRGIPVLLVNWPDAEEAEVAAPFARGDAFVQPEPPPPATGMRLYPGTGAVRSRR